MNFLLFMWFLASLWQHDLFWAASSNSFDVCLQDTSLESAQRRVKLSSPSVLSGEVGRSPSKFVYVFGRKWGLTVNNPGRTYVLLDYGEYSVFLSFSPPQPQVFPSTTTSVFMVLWSSIAWWFSWGICCFPNSLKQSLSPLAKAWDLLFRHASPFFFFFFLKKKSTTRNYFLLQRIWNYSELE